MITIKILGPVSTNCEKLERITRDAVDYIGVEAEIMNITDHDEIKDYRILSTPGLLIDEKVVCFGRIPTKGEITTWLADAAIEAG